MEIKFTRLPVFYRKKLLIIVMRLFIFLCCAVTFGFNPSTGFSQNVKIKIEEDKEVSVEEVFELIKKQTDYTFIYRSDIFKSTPKVFLKKGIISAHDLLLKSLSFNNMTYEITPQRTIRLKSESLQEQIRGTVLDENKQGLPGVNIAVKGTNKGAITDFNGTFLIDASLNDILVFTYVGYKTKEVTITELLLKHFYITLEPGVNQLEEVVVVSTGFQELPKERVTGSFAHVDEEVLDYRITTNILNTFEGIFTGVQVDNNNNITIRGISTLYANQEPLIVVDGFPIQGVSALESINPNDVKSVDILKDAAAASIWGTRAANGVIVITTKDGGSKKGLSIEASSYLTILEKEDFNTSNYLTAAQQLDLQLYGYDVFLKDNPRLESIAQIPNVSDSTREFYEMSFFNEIWNRRNTVDTSHPMSYSETEYQDLLTKLRNTDSYKQFSEHLMRTALNNQYNVSLRSVTENNSFRGSVVFNDDKTNFIGNETNRMVLNLRNRLKLSKKFALDVNANISYSTQDRNAPVTRFSSIRRFQPIVDENGDKVNTYLANPFFRDFHESLGLNYNSNLIDQLENNDNTVKSISARIQASLDYTIFDGLIFNTKYQYTRVNAKRRDHFTVDNPEWRAVINDFFLDTRQRYGAFPFGGKLNLENAESNSWSARASLNFNKTFNDNHLVNVIVGGDLIKNTSDVNSSTLLGYDDDTSQARQFDVVGLLGGGSVLPRNGSPWEWFDIEYSWPRTFSTDDREYALFSNASYTYNNKYSISGSLRVDKASIFGTSDKNRSNELWSVGARWNIQKENFLNNVGWIDRLAFRTTYGVNGNRPQAGSSAFTTGVVRFGFQLPNSIQYLRINNPGNPTIRGEKVFTLNTGLDYSLFSGFVHGSIDYYVRTSKDVIGPKDLPVQTGWFQQNINYAEMKNSGIEVSLNFSPIRTTNFRWNSNLNFSYNKNEIVDVELTADRDRDFLGSLTGVGLPVLGKPFNRMYAFRWGGLDAEGAPQIRTEDGTIISHALPNSNFDPSHVYYAGTTVAPYFGGFRNTFKYKEFTLGFNFTYGLGHVMRAPVGNSVISALHGFNDIHPSNLNYWKNPGDETITNVPAPGDPNNYGWSNWRHRYYALADINVLSASYIKLSDLNMEYSLPKSITSKIRIESASLIFQARNLWIWTANDWDIDPATGLFSLPKTFVAGLQVNL